MIKHLVILSAALASSLAMAQTATAPGGTVPDTAPAAQQTTTTSVTTTTGTAPAAATVQTTTTAANPADANKQAGDNFLTTNKTQQGVITLPSGLQYKILTKGNGPKPTKDDIVTVNYEGRHLNGQIFDSSYQRGQAASFPVNAVIPGWQEALQLMDVGDTWEIYIPANLAYGDHGVPGAIGPNETLIFKVNLISTRRPQPQTPVQ